MKQDARMAWYMTASRRPALLTREALIKLHGIVTPTKLEMSIRCPTHYLLGDIKGKDWIIVPEQLKIGKITQGDVIVLPNDKPLSSDQLEKIKASYFIVHLEGWSFGVEYQDEQIKLIALNPTGVAPFSIYDFLVVYPGDIENFPGNKFTTTCGRYLVNYYLIASVFIKKKEDMVDGVDALVFVNDLWKIQKIESIIARLLIDKKITVAAGNTYIDHGYFLSSISELYGSTMTRKSITPNKDILELKKKLYKKYEGQLNDPRIGTIIENELIAADKKSLKDDPSMAFLGDSGKKFNIHRKRQHLAMGLLEEFDSVKGNYAFIPESLSEGWDPKSFPTICNEIRKGSYDRGVETQIGGLDTKWMIAVFQNCRITAPDCGTTRTLPITITSQTAESYFGAYIQHDKSLFDNPKFMDFPKEEWEELIPKDHLYITKYGDDRNKYKLGDIVITPWKKVFVINSKIDYSNIEDYPLRHLYTEAQISKLKNKEISVFRMDELDIKSKYTPFTAKNYRLYLNKVINIRSMQYCQQSDGFCEVCAGKIFKDLDFTNIGTLPIDVGAVFLTLSMKSMHGTKIDSFELPLTDLEKYVVT